MKQPNPYVELGVDRNATTGEIKAAFKAAAKTAHPDAGGTAEAFHRLTIATRVLLNPTLRRKFDETGHFDQPDPDNERANAIGLIEAFMQTIVGAYLAGTGGDPRLVDVLEEFRTRTRGEINGMANTIRQHELHMTIVKDIGARFNSNDPARPLERAFEFRAKQLSDAIENLKKAMHAREVAIELSRTYEFRHDQPFMSPYVFVQVG